jgi:transcriptional regulator of arginine metabolism
VSERSLPGTKAARQGRIVELLTRRSIRSQTELADLLAAEGFAVTQGTLSRDLVDGGRRAAARGIGGVGLRGAATSRRPTSDGPAPGWRG